MLYKKGKMPLIVNVWDPALRRLISEKREADGISIWSVGRNRKNEQGQDQATVREYADDVRAKMIFKTAPAIDGPDGRDGLDGQRRAKQSGGKNAKKKNQ